jgi:homoserine dehydrogenase
VTTFNVGLLGHGTVGSSFHTLLEERADSIEFSTGMRPELSGVLTRSRGDFEDILGADTPAVWLTNRPAKGGDAGAMLATIIERAAKLKAKRINTKDTRKKASTRTKQKSRTRT